VSKRYVVLGGSRVYHDVMCGERPIYREGFSACGHRFTSMDQCFDEPPKYVVEFRSRGDDLYPVRVGLRRCKTCEKMEKLGGEK